jgi:hypothetical protein
LSEKRALRKIFGHKRELSNRTSFTCRISGSDSGGYENSLF